MRSLKPTQAVTLAELIITTVIMSIMIVGVFGANYAIQRMNKDVSGESQVNLQTKALAEMLRASVRKVHGDLTAPGITIDVDNKTLCFRQDVKGDDGQYTPSDYDDDLWDCFSQVNNSVYRCSFHPAPTAVCATSDRFVGTLVSEQFTDPSLVPSFESASGVLSFKMKLVARLKPDQPAGVDNMQFSVVVQESVGGF